MIYKMYAGEFLVELGFDRKVRGSIAGIIVGEALGLAYEHHDKLPDGDAPEMKGSFSDDGTEVRPSGECATASEMSLMTLFGEGDIDTVASWFMQWRTWDHIEAGRNTKQVLFDALEIKLDKGISPSESAFRASDAYSEAYPRDSDDDALLRSAAIFPYIDFSDPEEVWDVVDKYVKLTHSGDDTTLTCVMWIGLMHSAYSVQANVTLDDALRFVPENLKQQALDIIEPVKKSGGVEEFLSPFGWTVSTFQMAAAAVFSCLPQLASEEISEDTFLDKVYFEAIKHGGTAAKTASLAGSLAGMLAGIESFKDDDLKAVHAFIPIEDGYDFLTKVEW